MKNEIKKALLQAGYRERYAIENGSAVSKKYGNEDCISFEYDSDREYQDANGATWSINRQAWIG